MSGDGQIIQHRDIPLGHRHGFVNWEFATEAELHELYSVTVLDLHKVAYVEERDQYFSVANVDIGTGQITWKAWQNVPSNTANLTVSWSNGIATISAGGVPVQINPATTTTYGWMSPAQVVKLNGIAVEATKNLADLELLSRANHTGSQGSDTISDFQSAVPAALLNAPVAPFPFIEFTELATFAVDHPALAATQGLGYILLGGSVDAQPIWWMGEVTGWIDAMGAPMPPPP